MNRSVFIFVAIFSFSLYSVSFDSSEKLLLKSEAAAGLTLSSEDDDTFLTLFLKGTYHDEIMGVSMEIPLKIVLADSRDEIGTTFLNVPESEWDEGRDYLKILNYFSLGKRSDKYYLNVSSLENFYLGRGTILAGFSSDLIHNRTVKGVNAHIFSDYAGGELFASDVYDPSLLGARFYVKPFAYVAKESYANNLEVGFSVVSDRTMPDYRIEEDDAGRKTVKTTDGTIFGGDISFELFNSMYYTATVYIEVNRMNFGGGGWHFGLQNRFDIPAPVDFRIENRLEFKYYENNYSPTYFGTFYPVDKEYYRGNLTKLGYYSSSKIENGRMVKGAYGDFVFNVIDTIAFGGSLDIDTTPDEKRERRLNMFIHFPASKNFSLYMNYLKKSSDSLSDLFSSDDFWLLNLRSKLLIGRFIELNGGFRRFWKEDFDSMEYEALNELFITSEVKMEF